MTLEDYHKKYPKRPGDTVEKFARFEEFLRVNPRPEPNGNYFAWYYLLSKWMESAP